jgi:hypothetical protein
MADAKTATQLTQAQQIRLESVQLAYRHDRPSEEILKRASELAQYVEGQRTAAKPGRPGKAVNDQQVESESDLI